MPATNVLALEKVQAGKESTRGTGVAATRIVYAVVVGSLERPINESDNSTGTFADDGTIAYGRMAPTFTLTEDATFEDLPWWFQFALKNGVTGGAGDGGSPPMYTYTFIPTITSDDLGSFTMEFNESGLPYESDQVMIDEWTLTIDPDNQAAWRFSANAMGRTWVTTTYTGALSQRAREDIKAPGTLLYIDAGGGTIGTTQVTGKLISATITGRNALHFKGFAEDELFAAANKVGRGKQTFDAEITFEWDSDTEFANFRSAQPVERKVRLRSNGAIIHDAVTSRATIDLNGYWTTFSPGDRNGNKIITLNLSSRYNVTSGYMLSAAIQNDVSALP